MIGTSKENTLNYNLPLNSRSDYSPDQRPESHNSSPHLSNTGHSPIISGASQHTGASDFQKPCGIAITPTQSIQIFSDHKASLTTTQTTTTTTTTSSKASNMAEEAGTTVLPAYQSLEPPDARIIHISTQPAVSKKVVTTTTTTTTSYRPLVVPEPRSTTASCQQEKSGIDPNDYPLRHAQTPAILSSFLFDVQGRTNQFSEQIPQQTKTLKKDDDDAVNISSPSSSFKQPNQSPSVARKRPASTLQYGTISSDMAELKVSNLNTSSYPDHSSSSSHHHPVRRDEHNHHVEESTALPPLQAKGHKRRMTAKDIEALVSDVAPDYAPTPNPSVSSAALPSPSPSVVSGNAAIPPRNNSRQSKCNGKNNDDPIREDTCTEPDTVMQDDGIESSSAVPDREAYFEQDVQSSCLPDIPVIIQTFDRLPSKIQDYVMYQLLRRCNRKSLSMISNVVAPALRCDFLASLPPELSLKIVQYLDVKSLCTCAQVSKTWKSIIESVDWLWKNLLKEAAFDLEPGEVQQAIRGKWWLDTKRNFNITSTGLAYPVGSQNTLGDQSMVDADPDNDSPFPLQSPAESASDNVEEHSSIQFQASHSSEGAREETPHNQQREGYRTPRSPLSSSSSGLELREPGADDLSADVGLYKSIFRRRHIINKKWMSASTSKPRRLSFRGHGSHVVACLQFDADKIVTGSDDLCINIYDTATGALRKQLKDHEGGVWALQYVDNILVSGSTDRTVRVWDIQSAKCTHVLYGHSSTVRCLQILLPTEVGVDEEHRPIMMPKEPLIITGSRDSTLRIWKMPPGLLDNKYGNPKAAQREGNNNTATGVSGDHSVNYKASSSVPTGPEFAEAADPASNTGGINGSSSCLRTLVGHVHSVRAIAAHADTLVSGSYDTTVKVWRISKGDCIWTLSGHQQKVFSVVLDHERNRCISGSLDWLIKVWSLENGTCLQTLEGHTSLVGLLNLGQTALVSGAADSTLRVWDPETYDFVRKLDGHSGAITCFQNDNYKVISGSDEHLKLWDIRSGKLACDLMKDLTRVWQVKFDSRRCVAAVLKDMETFIEVWDFDYKPEQDDPFPSCEANSSKHTSAPGENIKIEEISS